MDAYTLGAFAVAVAGVIALVWVVLRAVTNLAVIAAVKKDEKRQDTHSIDPYAQQPMPFPFGGFSPAGAPIPPPTPPPPVPFPPEEETQPWPQREETG